MRSIWNGAISFGLVSIPIKLVNATESHSISFRQIHLEDGGRIRYRKVCELEDKEVTAEEIGKAYEDADGSMVPITEDDLARLPIPTAKTIEIVAFVPADRIDPLQMGAAYYLAANGVPAAKPYTLLREALKRSRKVAIAKFALRGRERLGMLRVVDDVIAMHGLLWPDEIRAPEDVAPQSSVTVRDAELDLADALMDTLGEVDISDLHDDYRAAVEEMIAAKSEGGAAVRTPAAPTGGGRVIDLMAALENSVQAAKEARGEPGQGVAEVTHLAGRTRKKATARKATKTAKTAKAEKAEKAEKSTAAKRTTPEQTPGKAGSTTKKTATKRTTRTTKAAAKSAAEPAAKKKATAAKKSTSRTRTRRASA
ncbi:non-homologous end joining protein Ku [Streptomyces beihaiensis]|uniref:Non-homologous end joining protein Ku n=1 Tax=Streptomyces beihaiensis TaxID=2984495 RepID=A0ABT3U4S3_9ACTN|nr:Ku protein [Streptomyces beihaiensis]MCX3064065.1 Ku protein [Streptomyces beihaiensis]